MKWHETVHHGKWVSGVNAGGSGLTHLTTHKGRKNAQYRKEILWYSNLTA